MAVAGAILEQVGASTLKPGYQTENLLVSQFHVVPGRPKSQWVNTCCYVAPIFATGRAQPIPTTMAVVRATKLKMRMKKVCQSCSARDFATRTWICCATGMEYEVTRRGSFNSWARLSLFFVGRGGWDVFKGLEVDRSDSPYFLSKHVFLPVRNQPQTLQDLETALAEAESKIAELQEKTMGTITSGGLTLRNW